MFLGHGYRVCPPVRAVFHVNLERGNNVLYKHQLYCKTRGGIGKRRTTFNFLDTREKIGGDFFVLLLSCPKKTAFHFFYSLFLLTLFFCRASTACCGNNAVSIKNKCYPKCLIVCRVRVFFVRSCGGTGGYSRVGLPKSSAVS